MAKILISTDTTSDLSKDLIEKYGIKQTPLHVLLGETEYSDGVDITPQDIFNYVKKSGILPKTSAASMVEYGSFFEENLKEYDYIIHFTISAELSSTYNNARLVAESLGGKVAVIDSRNLSTGQGLLVLKACDMREEGKSFEEIVDALNETRFHVQTSFVVDTLDYLHKGGRCSGVAKIAAAILKLHPSIDMVEGKLVPKKKYRGIVKKCIETYVKDLATEYKNYDDTRVFITHSCCDQETIDAITSLVKEHFNFKNIYVTTAGSVITSHCGQGTLGVLFIKN